VSGRTDRRSRLPWDHGCNEAEHLNAWAEKLAEEMAASTNRRSNETELREDVEHWIRQALAELHGINLEQITAETNTLPKGGGRSPVDKIYGGVLVEYECNMNAAKRRHGADQGLGYLRNIEETTQAKGAFTAVVTDGR